MTQMSSHHENKKIPHSLHLRNGISCFLIEAPAPGTAIHLAVGEGSTHDSVEKSGETHLLEHLFFAPRQNLDNEEPIAARIERLGGLYNAHVHKEYSTYWIECLPTNVPAALELLIELINTPSWAKEVIESEYALMEEEYVAYQTTYPLILSDRIEHDVLEGPVNRSLFSEFSGLSNRSASLFTQRHIEHWQKAPLTVYIVGSIPENLVASLERTLGKIHRNANSNEVRDHSKWKNPLPKVVEVPIGESVQQESHLAWLIPLPSLPLEADGILTQLFGGSSSSRIGLACRSAGVAYSIDASTLFYRDISYLYVSATVPASKEFLCRVTVEEALQSYAAQPVSNEELIRAQNTLYANMVRESHDASAVASVVVHDAESGNIHASIAQRLQAVKSHTLESMVKMVIDIAGRERTYGVLRS